MDKNNLFYAFSIFDPICLFCKQMIQNNGNCCDTCSIFYERTDFNLNITDGSNITITFSPFTSNALVIIITEFNNTANLLSLPFDFFNQVEPKKIFKRIKKLINIL